MQEIIETFICQESTLYKVDNRYEAGGKEIFGENEISIEDCIKRTENTVNAIKDILALTSVSPKWKAAFIASLYLLEDKAISCCRAGGVWKACLQPLLEKWINLKEWERECRRSGHWYLLD